MKKSSVLILLFSVCTGCVAVWGQSYHVEYADSHLMIIKYDTSVANYGAMEKEAQKNCSKYNKDADEIDRADMISGGIQTLTIHCLKKDDSRDTIGYVRERKKSDHHSVSCISTGVGNVNYQRCSD